MLALSPFAATLASDARENGELAYGLILLVPLTDTTPELKAKTLGQRTQCTVELLSCRSKAKYWYAFHANFDAVPGCVDIVVRRSVSYRFLHLEWIDM